MNEKNLEYLKDQLKFTGFGEALENELKEKMQKQAPDFMISHNAKFGNDTTIANLHFKKSDQSDMYFFNRYNLSVNQQGGNTAEQTFYINKGNNITLKEAYNLISGRAVNKDLFNKEGQIYNAWVQLDFKQTENNGNYKLKQFHQNYGFDLKNALEKHPIKELNNEQDKNRLIDSLEKGNRQSVTFIENSSEKKYFIEANPQYKTINVYDINMQRLTTNQSQTEKQVAGETKTIEKENKKEKQTKAGDDDSAEVAKDLNKKKPKRRQSI